MELRDAAGQKVKLLKPELELAGTYPDFLDWGVLRMRISGLNSNLEQIHAGQWQEFNRHGDIQLAEGRPLALKDVFAVKEPGTYQLTLWPKIYKRSEKPDDNRDIFQRIDLPAVAMTIKWPH